MGVLGGRFGVLREALPQGREALIPVLERNVTLIEGADKDRLAAEVETLARQLDAASDEDLMAARIAR